METYWELGVSTSAPRMRTPAPRPENPAAEPRLKTTQNPHEDGANRATPPHRAPPAGSPKTLGAQPTQQAHRRPPGERAP